MEKFPIVNETQVVLSRAENATGKVLDEQFKHYRQNPDQKVHTVFNSIDEAIEYVKSIFKVRSDTEFIIFDSKEKVLKCFYPNEPIE